MNCTCITPSAPVSGPVQAPVQSSRSVAEVFASPGQPAPTNTQEALQRMFAMPGVRTADAYAGQRLLRSLEIARSIEQDAAAGGTAGRAGLRTWSGQVREDVGQAIAALDKSGDSRFTPQLRGQLTRLSATADAIARDGLADPAAMQQWRRQATDVVAQAHSMLR